MNLDLTKNYHYRSRSEDFRAPCCKKPISLSPPNRYSSPCSCGLTKIVARNWVAGTIFIECVEIGDIRFDLSDGRLVAEDRERGISSR